MLIASFTFRYCIYICFIFLYSILFFFLVYPFVSILLFFIYLQCRLSLICTSSSHLMIALFSEHSRLWQCWKINFMIYPCTYNLCSISAVTWLRFRHFITSGCLQLSQHFTITCHLYTSQMASNEQNGEFRSKIASLNHMMSYLMTACDLLNDCGWNELISQSRSHEVLFNNPVT